MNQTVKNELVMLAEEYNKKREKIINESYLALQKEASRAQEEVRALLKKRKIVIDGEKIKREELKKLANLLQKISSGEKDVELLSRNEVSIFLLTHWNEFDILLEEYIDAITFIDKINVDTIKEFF